MSNPTKSCPLVQAHTLHTTQTPPPKKIEQKTIKSAITHSLPAATQRLVLCKLAVNAVGHRFHISLVNQTYKFTL